MNDNIIISFCGILSDKVFIKFESDENDKLRYLGMLVVYFTQLLDKEVHISTVKFMPPSTLILSNAVDIRLPPDLFADLVSSIKPMIESGLTVCQINVGEQCFKNIIRYILGETETAATEDHDNLKIQVRSVYTNHNMTCLPDMTRLLGGISTHDADRWSIVFELITKIDNPSLEINIGTLVLQAIPKIEYERQNLQSQFYFRLYTANARDCPYHIPAKIIPCTQSVATTIFDRCSPLITEGHSCKVTGEVYQYLKKLIMGEC